MAEVVGLLANVGALAEAGFKLISLINTIRQGGKHRMQLLTELNSLWLVLKMLECHFDPSEQEMSEPLLDTIKLLNQDGGVFHKISETFENLTDRLLPRTGPRKVIQTLRWPFEKSEVEQLTLQLERLKSTVSLAYGSANAAVVREIQNDTKNLRLNAANDQVKAIIDWISDLNFLKQQNTLKNQNTAVMILYCGYNQARSQSVGSLIAALIKQGLQIRPAISEELKELYNVHARTDVFPSLTELTKILRAELDKFDNCFIIIDGLDELLDEAKRQELLNTLTRGNVNVLVTSRPLDTVKDLFWSSVRIICDGCDAKTLRYAHHCKQCLGGGFDVCEDCNRKSIVCGKDGHYLFKRYGVTEIEIEATPSDIRNYIGWRIDHEPRLFDIVQRKRNLRDEISSTIVQQANGMFLLARLHMDSLATNRTPQGVQLALQNLPNEIWDTYDRAMERIEATNDQDRAIVMNLLRWVVFATRPLIVAEVEHASSIVIGTSDVDQDNSLRAGELTSMCAGLVIVDASDIVRLCHFSAQTYFREHRPSERADFKRRMDHYPMIEYSASYWGFHAAHAEPLPEVADQIFNFLRSKPNRESAIQAMWYSDALDLADWEARSGVQPLHLAAFFGLNLVVTQLLETQEDPIDCRDSLGTTPLMYAAARGHTQVVQTLLRRGSDPNLQCDAKNSALHCAIASNHVEVVRHLLDVSSIDVNTAGFSARGFTPLMLAAYNTREEILMMLLRIPSLDVNMPIADYHHFTALTLAACVNNVTAVREILAHPDCDVNKRGSWRTPISTAASSGWLSVVEILLDHGADLEIQDGPHSADGTSLNRAIENGHAGVVKFLLGRGASPQVVDPYNRTIIHSAAANGQNETLRVLFERPIGVDINQQATNGRTALHDAAYLNYCETIRILFENGASTQIRDGADRSPLGVAEDMNNIEAVELLHKLRNQEVTRENLDKDGPLCHTQSSLDSTGQSFLTIVRLGKKDAVQAYVQDPKNDTNVVDLDEPPNIKINTLDRFERSPLHWTTLYDRSPAADLLVHAGAGLELKDRFLDTALHIALNHRHSDSSIVLLEAGSVLEECDLQPALQLAAQLGSAGLVKRLVSMGGNPEMKDRNGMTLVQRAEVWENWGIVGTTLKLCEEKEKNWGREKGAGELVVPDFMLPTTQQFQRLSFCGSSEGAVTSFGSFENCLCSLLLPGVQTKGSAGAALGERSDFRFLITYIAKAMKHKTARPPMVPPTMTAVSFVEGNGDLVTDGRLSGGEEEVEADIELADADAANMLLEVRVGTNMVKGVEGAAEDVRIDELAVGDARRRLVWAIGDIRRRSVLAVGPHAK
ncbi:MAG: hypothetical protein Q9203_003589 [Teloschistes exilis]